MCGKCSLSTVALAMYDVLLVRLIMSATPWVTHVGLWMKPIRPRIPDMKKRRKKKPSKIILALLSVAQEITRRVARTAPSAERPCMRQSALTTAKGRDPLEEELGASTEQPKAEWEQSRGT